METQTRHGYTTGDYVTVSHPGEFTDYTPGEDTFVVKGFTTNVYGTPLVNVRRATDSPRDRGTVFYPWELSWEDGTRPPVNAL